MAQKRHLHYSTERIVIDVENQNVNYSVKSKLMADAHATEAVVVDRGEV